MKKRQHDHVAETEEFGQRLVENHDSDAGCDCETGATNARKNERLIGDLMNKLRKRGRKGRTVHYEAKEKGAVGGWSVAPTCWSAHLQRMERERKGNLESFSLDT